MENSGKFAMVPQPEYRKKHGPVCHTPECFSDSSSDHEYIGKEQLIVANSSAVHLLRQQLLNTANETNKNKKHPNVLISDMDWTMVMNDYDRAMRGYDTREFASSVEEIQVLKGEKNIPFIINTAKPYDSKRAESFSKKTGLPDPEVLVTGMGTSVHWRQESDGKFIRDEEYGKRIAEQTITYTENGIQKTGPFDVSVVSRLVKGPINENIGPNFASPNHEIYFDSQMEDGTYRGGHLRFEVIHVPYFQIEAAVKAVQEAVPGVKMNFCEGGDFHLYNGEGSTHHNFTGFLYIIPANAGKDSAAKYVLEKMNSALQPGKDQKIVANIVGDGPNDIDILTMRAKPEDPFVLKQFLVESALYRTKIEISNLLEKIPEADRPDVRMVDPVEMGVATVLRGIGKREIP